KSASADSERPAVADVQREHLDRIAALVAIDADSIKTGAYRQIHRVARLAFETRQVRTRDLSQAVAVHRRRAEHEHLEAQMKLTGGLVLLDQAHFAEPGQEPMSRRLVELGLERYVRQPEARAWPASQCLQHGVDAS